MTAPEARLKAAHDSLALAHLAGTREEDCQHIEDSLNDIPALIEENKALREAVFKWAKCREQTIKAAALVMQGKIPRERFAEKLVSGEIWDEAAKLDGS